MLCLDPPLDSIPKDQWFCFTCLSGTGGDFGFDEGEEHSLSIFQARDKEFRHLWFELHPPPNAEVLPHAGDIAKTCIGNVTVSEYDVEEEFSFHQDRYVVGIILLFLVIVPILIYTVIIG